MKAELSYVDPHIPVLPDMRSFEVPDLQTEQLTAEYLASLDAVLISTDHTVFDYQLIADHAGLVIDTRNAMAQTDDAKARVVKA